MVQFSGNLLFAAFLLYLLASFFFAGAINKKKQKENKSLSKTSIIAITLTIAGFISQMGYFITRWMAAGHAPVSNLFEFTTFFGMVIVGAFIVIFFI